MEGGVKIMDFVSFVMSILASIIAAYICKWLDKDR